ncbi:MAG: hypothetical protein V2I47_11255 [Bacteroidales bacterium]|jgi:hypothetical protein|nr:hypothetical protein [Bacteroidales bacterium]
MDTGRRIRAFAKLGNTLAMYGDGGVSQWNSLLDEAVDKALQDNAWFTGESVKTMLSAIGESLQKEDLEQWIAGYNLPEKMPGQNVAVVMAGNVPAVGFHDLLCVLISGNRLYAKLSSDDKQLLPAMCDILKQEEPGFAGMIRFTEDKLTGFDAVIATGSNNTSRYFNYYFGKYPHIIRKNRNGIAVLTGNESGTELNSIGKDIFTYYGLGCRNVSKLFVPVGYDLRLFLDAMQPFEKVGDHHKYRNNYDYNKSIYLVNGDKHFDNGFLLLKEDTSMASPVSVLFFEPYSGIDALNDLIRRESENIQCVVSIDKNVHGAIPPGTTQHPKLWDYADGVDTMKFLVSAC